MGTAFQHASLRHTEGCHLPRLDVYYSIVEYMYIKTKNTLLDSNHTIIANNALWDLNHVAKYDRIKNGVIKPYDNLRL